MGRGASDFAAPLIVISLDLYVCHLKNQGSNGEVAYLSEDERVAIVKAVRETVPRESGKLIIAGE